MDGDLFDIIPGITGVQTDLYMLERHQKRKGHCTSFVRVWKVENGILTQQFTGDELYCAHNTWDSYQTMVSSKNIQNSIFQVRIFKRYHFPTSDSNVQAPNVLMSSYPSCLSSVDDFYVLSRYLLKKSS